MNTRRPSFQFYPGDWTSNSNLRRCSHAEKGAWLECLCLMHEQDRYGTLSWPLEEIALAIAATVELLRGLIRKGVLKGADAGETVEAFTYTPRHAGQDGESVTLIEEQTGPLWYSSRMVKDEHIRQRKGAATRFEKPDLSPNGSPEASPYASPMPPIGDGIGSRQGDGSTSTSSSTSTTTSNTEDQRLSTKSPTKKRPKAPAPSAQVSERFERFWNAYPKKQAKAEALKAFLTIDPGDALVDQMLHVVEQFKHSETWRSEHGKYVPHPATWLNRQGWHDEPVVGVVPKMTAGQTTAARIASRMPPSNVASIERMEARARQQNAFTLDSETVLEVRPQQRANPLTF